jgi:CheY-like chemotaxis protein
MERPRHILLVDDDALILEVLKTHFEHEGYRVSLADNCREAMEKLRLIEPVDLVVLDYLMPEGLGTDLLESIAEDRSLQRPRVIVSSSLLQSAETAWETRLKRLPAISQSLIRGYVHKPYTLERMDNTIEEILNERWSGDYRPTPSEAA